MATSFFPVSHRLNQLQELQVEMGMQDTEGLFGGGIVGALLKSPSGNGSHPDLAHLILLVFEAVLEVVFISLPGYLLARVGKFNAKQQKYLAELNTNIFTPALIFTKLASQLTADKLADLAIIPVIFAIQTLVCYVSAQSVSRLFGFKKRAKYFVIAMSVFGNSNSLPISLVMSLSMTLRGLHWYKIPGDNDNEVAARGILYLLIFQQLGQVVRWSWGYNVLLAPADQFPDEDEGRNSNLERGEYLATEPALATPLLTETFPEDDEGTLSGRYCPPGLINVPSTASHSDYESGNVSPVGEGSKCVSSSASSISLENDDNSCTARENLVVPVTNRAYAKLGLPDGENNITSFPQPSPTLSENEEARATTKPWWWTRCWIRCRNAIKRAVVKTSRGISYGARASYKSLPSWMQTALAAVANLSVKIWNGLNPPLWAMIAAIIVASFPKLQHLFYDKGTFINNSFTRAISQSGGVAVPLILLVLGGSLARNTLPEASRNGTASDPKFERNLLIASIISRMLVPFLVMTPVLALMAKYVPVSILDDPIFVVVCFLLIGAPTALQVAQICQMNDVYMGTMSKILFQGYVVWILPSTLILVMVALEVVKWAA